jgi:hypothetical protein
LLFIFFSQVPSLFYLCASVIAGDCNAYAPSLLSLPPFVLGLLLKSFGSIPFGFVSLLELKYNDPEIRQHTPEFVWEKALADAKCMQEGEGESDEREEKREKLCTFFSCWN